MRLAKYCKEQGMNIAEYETTCELVQNIANSIMKEAKDLHKPGTGMYYPVSEIIKDTPLTPFVIQQLKIKGMEFIENGSLYRI